MRRRNRPVRHATLAAGLLALVALSTEARAAGGRVPIYQVPVTITDPGSYYLTEDLTHFGAGESIVIQASDVTIDFNGHTLTKDSNGNYTVAMDGDYTNITIRNGTIIQGNIGIRLKNTIGGDFNVRIENMSVRNTLNEGIYVYGQSLIGSSQVFILGNTIHDTGNDGIHLRFMWGGRVADNVIQGAGDNGIYGNSLRGVTLTRNTISHSSGDGIALWYSWYCAIDWNHMTYGNDWGFYVFSGDQLTFSNNRAYGNGAGGFSIPGAEGHVNAGGNYPPP